MKDLATVVPLAMHLFLVAVVIWFGFVVTRRLQRHQEQLRILELKTGWLRVQEGPGKRVEVVGSLNVQPCPMMKDEDTPYVS